MNIIEGWDREQGQLFPESLEDYVGADNPVRLLDVFVEGLDLRVLGFIFPKSDPQGRGAPGYHPAALLKLYLYGYLNQVRASRRLEAECKRNNEVMWLMRKLAPDFKTIADFRKDNRRAFVSVLRQFNQLCRELELFGGQLLAVDGTKIKGQNALDQNWTRTKLKRQARRLEKRVKEYLAALDEADLQEGPRPAAALSAQQLQEKIQQVRERQKRLQDQMAEMEKKGVSEISASDPDSRVMMRKGQYVVGYNVQAVSDAKHHLLVTTEVSQAASDQGQLAPMVRAAKAELEIEQAEVVADGGYVKSQDIKECQDIGIEPHLPAVENSPSERAGLYGKADFRYDAQRDVYECPGGAALTYYRDLHDKGRELFAYKNPRACARCPLKARCTTGNYRTVSRWEHEERMERMAAAVRAAPQKLDRRKALIEHCCGALHWLLPGGFLVKGVERVRAELSLATWAYNFKRALAVLGMAQLLEALTKRTAHTAAA
jgi:transposase